MHIQHAVLAAALVSSVFAQTPFSDCASNHNASYCEGNSLQGPIILRCSESDSDTPQAGNCNDNLAGFGTEGRLFGYCWQSSPTAGDAQCTAECVRVTAVNGTSFYPLGCNDTSTSMSSSSSSSTSTSTSTSSSVSGSTSGSTRSGTTSSRSTSTSSASASLVGGVSTDASASAASATATNSGDSMYSGSSMLESFGIGFTLYAVALMVLG